MYTQPMIQFMAMEQTPRAVTWEAPEHNHTEKGGDWYFAFAVIFFAIVMASVMLGNPLFALLMGVAGLALAISVSKRPAIIPYSVSVRGVRVGDETYPYSSLVSYTIDEEDPKGPQLLVKSSRHFMPLIVFTLPTEHIDDIETILRDKLPEEFLEEPFFVKVLEIFGF